MRVSFFIFFLSILSISCKLTVESNYVKNPAQYSLLEFDSITYKRPMEAKNDYPGFLTLYNNKTFKYFSMPSWSCYLKTNVKGKWSINGDTLNLKRDLSFELYRMDSSTVFKPFAIYKIKGKTLNLLGENKNIHPGWVEPELTAKVIIQKLFYDKNSQ